VLYANIRSSSCAVLIETIIITFSHAAAVRVSGRNVLPASGAISPLCDFDVAHRQRRIQHACRSRAVTISEHTRVTVRFPSNWIQSGELLRKKSATVWYNSAPQVFRCQTLGRMNGRLLVHHLKLIGLPSTLHPGHSRPMSAAVRVVKTCSRPFCLRPRKGLQEELRLFIKEDLQRTESRSSSLCGNAEEAQRKAKEPSVSVTSIRRRGFIAK
jgi:hypothetical protein